MKRSNVNCGVDCLEKFRSKVKNKGEPIEAAAGIEIGRRRKEIADEITMSQLKSWDFFYYK